MYSYMLQAVEERLHKKCAKVFEEEAAPSSSALVMNIDDFPSAVPSLASTSSPCTTTPPSCPSSLPSSVASTDTPEEPLFSSPPQNPSLLITSTTFAGDGVVVVIADAPPLFPISVKVSSLDFPMASFDASSSLVSSLDLEAPSASSIPPSPSSFSLETNVFLEENLPSPFLIFASPGTSILPSTSPSSLELSPTSPPCQESISPSPETLSSYPLLLASSALSSPFPSSSTLQEGLMSPIENLDKTLQLVNIT